MRGKYQNRSGRKITAGCGAAGGWCGGVRAGLGVGVEDRVEQAGEAVVDVLLAQLGVAPGALDALGDEAGLAEYTTDAVH